MGREWGEEDGTGWLQQRLHTISLSGCPRQKKIFVKKPDLLRKKADCKNQRTQLCRHLNCACLLNRVPPAKGRPFNCAPPTFMGNKKKEIFLGQKKCSISTHLSGGEVTVLQFCICKTYLLGKSFAQV